MEFLNLFSLTVFNANIFSMDDLLKIINDFNFPFQNQIKDILERKCNQ